MYVAEFVADSVREAGSRDSCGSHLPTFSDFQGE